MIGPFSRAANTARIASALGAKDLRVAWSYRLSFILGHIAVFGEMIVFYFVSKVIGQGQIFGSPQDYFEFVVVGMALAGLLETALSASMAAARGDQVQGTLEAIASLPINPSGLGLGWVFFPLIDGLIGATITVLLAIPLGFTAPHPDLLAIVAVGLLSIAIFASLGFIGTGIVLAFQQGGGAITFALGGLALISGTLFPVTVLPDWLQLLSDISPLRYSLDGIRDAVNGASLSDVSRELTILGLFVLALIPVGLGALNAGFAHARKTGGLGRF